MNRRYIATHNINYIDKLIIFIDDEFSHISYTDENYRPYRVFTVLRYRKTIILDESNGVIRKEMRYSQAYACYRQLFADLKKCGYEVTVKECNNTVKFTVVIDGTKYTREV